jgi:flagella basal body P-ring formation protein FlgA
MKISRQILWLLFVFQFTLPVLATSSFNDVDTIADDENTSFDLTILLSEYLETVSKEYAEKGYRSEFSIGNIDPYHKIKDCDHRPVISNKRSPLKQARITTELRCNGTKPWKLYVGSEFKLYSQTVVAATSIRRGQVISANDLLIKEIVINQSNYSLYDDISDVVGMIAKRSIRAESTIQPGHLLPPKLVKRGDNVIIVARNSAISVRMNGTALSDGALGQQIPVRNTRSNRVVKARVSKAGLVTITL